ncbi:MAG: hypothetical protein ACK47C_07770 [Paracoccaceae bacterium]
MTDLSIIGKGLSNWIARGGKPVAGPYTSHQNALTALRGVEARQKPVLIRPCLRCGNHFKSTGRGNRLCDGCKKEC